MYRQKVRGFPFYHRCRTADPLKPRNPIQIQTKALKKNSPTVTHATIRLVFREHQYKQTQWASQPQIASLTVWESYS